MSQRSDSDLILQVIIPEGVVATPSFRGKRTRRTEVRLECRACGWRQQIPNIPRSVVLLQQSHFSYVIRRGKSNTYRCKSS